LQESAAEEVIPALAAVTVTIITEVVFVAEEEGIALADALEVAAEETAAIATDGVSTDTAELTLDDEATTATEELLGVTTTAGALAVVEATLATEVAATEALEPVAAAAEAPAKFALAVTLPPLVTSTLLTITTSPLLLVTLTSTVVVPNPDVFSKKL